MRNVIVFAVFAMFSALPVGAQVQPVTGGGDPRLQQVDYDARSVVQLRGSPGYQLMVEFSPDEQVQNVAVGDSGAWQVSVNREGDRLFLKPSQAGVATNMTVVTSVRVYNFDLNSVGEPSPDMPYTVQFRYPTQKAAADNSGYIDVSAAARRMSHYKVSGDRQVQPSSITNDGQHTYISWPKSAAIPAVYAPDRSGHDVLVNGMMGTDDVYVVDGAPQMLTFRIDKSVARAVRIQPRKAR